MRVRTWIVVAPGALGAVVLAWWLLARRPVVAPPAPAVAANPPPVPEAAPAAPPVDPPTAPEAAAAAPTLAAHAAVAEALGYVAIRCFVGTEWDTDDLVGKYHQRIAGGWYTNVENALAGRHGVERRYPIPGQEGPMAVTFENLFEVSWSAAAPGDVVPCTVHPIEHAELQVRLVDDAGRPAAGFQVYGCSGDDVTDADGLAVLEVEAGDPCRLTAYAKATEGHALCRAHADEPALVKDEVRRVELRLECLTVEEHIARRDEPDPPPRGPPPDFLPEIPDAEELARFRELARRDFGPEGNALVGGLVAHRERMIALRAESDAQAAEMAALLARMEALAEPGAEAATPEEQQALHEEMMALIERMKSTGP